MCYVLARQRWRRRDVRAGAEKGGEVAAVVVMDGEQLPAQPEQRANQSGNPRSPHGSLLLRSLGPGSRRESLDEIRVEAAGLEIGVVEDPPMQRYRCVNPLDDEHVERAAHTP